jgi:broad specificity phosphatase PhoE
MTPQSIRIFLVRHGQSEASLDKSVNARLQPRASGVSVWLTGALPEAFDRFKAVHVSIDDDLQGGNERRLAANAS